MSWKLTLFLVILYVMFYGLTEIFLGIRAHIKKQRLLHAEYQRLFQAEYGAYLSSIEGTEFFCYTSRTNSRWFIEEHILPSLDGCIKVILLEGRDPRSKEPTKFIQNALYKIEHIGFPNVMKVIDGQMFDRSLHSELYNTINRNLPPAEFLRLVKEALKELRQIEALRKSFRNAG